MEVTESIWSIIRDLNRAAQVQRRAAARAPLGPTTMGVLNLAAQAPVTPSQAAQVLQVPAQSITRAVDELTAAGFARRAGRTADGRSYAVELTSDGRAARDRLRTQLTEDLRHLLVDWTASEIDTFAANLARLVDDLDRAVPTGKPVGRRPNPWRSEDP